MNSKDQSQRGRSGRSKVKTGCRTCKVRKVKCDEGRPACARCVSTGRECDGYGVWGGGGNSYGARLGAIEVKPQYESPKRPLTLLPTLASDNVQREYFEWFRSHTSKKLPATFISDFWQTLVLQASVTEPAVLHGVLCLSSVNKKHYVSVDGLYRDKETMDDQDQFSLQQYGKSIGLLLPQLRRRDRASYRVALITCIIFICVDLLRSHFETAQLHLKQGLITLQEMQLVQSDASSTSTGSSQDLTDDWILEAFSRFSFQFELFEHLFQRPRLQLVTPDRPLSLMTSIRDAWQHLDDLFCRISFLADDARRGITGGLEPSEQQKLIRKDLAQWKEVFKPLHDVRFGPHPSIHTDTIHRLLRAYHTMAVAMLETSLCSEDELSYDNYTSHFFDLVTQLTTLWKARAGIHSTKKIPKHLVDMSHSTIDVGWLPPLHYVAVKCRVHRLRLQAVRLMECSIHREGIWDARISSLIARKIMEYEEGDYFKSLGVDDSFQVLDSPSLQDLCVPTLPAPRRLHGASVELAGSPVSRILLYSREQDADGRRQLVSECNVRTRRWKDRRDAK